MTKFREFLAALNTPGGYILILFILFNEGIFFYHYIDATGGGQIINLSFGALSGYLTAKEMDRRKLQVPIPSDLDLREASTKEVKNTTEEIKEEVKKD